MQRKLLLTLSLAASLFSTAQAADSTATEGWTPLFNGKNLDGWVQRGGKAKYRVEDNQIIGTCVSNTPNSFLCTVRDYTNFVFELEFKVSNGLNSGVQFRSHSFDHATQLEFNGKTNKVPANRVHGYQAEIDPSARAWTAGIYEEGRRGWLFDLKNNEAARKAFKSNDWNSLKIEAKGPSLKTWLNGVPAAELNDKVETSGFFALQVHGVGKKAEEMEVRFRQLRLKELP